MATYTNTQMIDSIDKAHQHIITNTFIHLSFNDALLSKIKKYYLTQTTSFQGLVYLLQESCNNLLRRRMDLWSSTGQFQTIVFITFMRLAFNFFSLFPYFFFFLMFIDWMIGEF